MAGDDEHDTTYSHVSQPPRRRKRRKVAPRERTLSSAPPSDDDDALEHSRHGLGVEDIETLLEAGEYEKVRAILGPPDRAAGLPPPLALLYIAARGEIEQGADLADLPHLAVKTSASLLKVSKQSRAARLVAKRLLGLSTPRLAPSRPAMHFVVGALILGLIIGFLAARAL